MARVALDRSLIFHRLQEARQELFEARSGHATLPPHERARLVARCEANVARAESQLARATEADARPPVQARPGRAEGGAHPEMSDRDLKTRRNQPVYLVGSIPKNCRIAFQARMFRVAA